MKVSVNVSLLQPAQFLGSCCVTSSTERLAPKIIVYVTKPLNIMVAQGSLGIGTAVMLHVRSDVIWQGHTEQLTKCLSTLCFAHTRQLLVPPLS